MNEHKWLASEESEVGKEGGDYDFKRVKMEEVHSRVVALEEEQEQLGRRLNKKVLGMMEKAEPVASLMRSTSPSKVASSV